MTTNHLLSTSLFEELFQHNMVSPDGRIIANEKQLEDYYTFLVNQSKDRIVSLYKERKNMVNDVQRLLHIDVRTDQQTNLLKKLLNELDLKFEEDGLLVLKEHKKSKRMYLGPAEPKMTLFEREIAEELKRVQILKRDLKVLDDWLGQIYGVSSASAPARDQGEWKAAGLKFRQRTKNRMCDMENARTKLIKKHYSDYDQMLQKILVPKMLKIFPKGCLPKKKIREIKIKIEPIKVKEEPYSSDAQKSKTGAGTSGLKSVSRKRKLADGNKSKSEPTKSKTSYASGKVAAGGKIDDSGETELKPTKVKEEPDASDAVKGKLQPTSGTPEKVASRKEERASELEAESSRSDKGKVEEESEGKSDTPQNDDAQDIQKHVLDTLVFNGGTTKLEVDKIDSEHVTVNTDELNGNTTADSSTKVKNESEGEMETSEKNAGEKGEKEEPEKDDPLDDPQ